MKIQLNLIRDRVVSSRVKKLRRILFVALLGVFLLLIMVMGNSYIDKYYKTRDCQNQLTWISKQYEALNPEVFRIVKYKEEWDSLHHKISLTSELRGEQIWWTPKLQALSRLIPENIWINRLSVKKSKPRPQKVASSGAKTHPAKVPPSIELILEGFALPGDNRGFRSIENFAHQLKENPTFGAVIKSINLTTAKRTEKGKLPAMNFRLSCRLAAEEQL